MYKFTERDGFRFEYWLSTFGELWMQVYDLQTGEIMRDEIVATGLYDGEEMILHLDWSEGARIAREIKRKGMNICLEYCWQGQGRIPVQNRKASVILNMFKLVLKSDLESLTHPLKESTYQLTQLFLYAASRPTQSMGVIA